MIERESPYGSDSIVGVVLNAAEKIRKKDAAAEASLTASHRLMLELSKRAIECEKLAEEWERKSMVDPLTGLDNLNRYKRISEQEFDPIRDDGHVAVTYIDVDNLKLVNDTMGHDAGDAMLQATAELLQSGSRKAGNTVFRLGGDEFIIVSRTHPGSIISDEYDDGGEETHGETDQKIGLEDSLTIMMERISKDALAMEPKISFSYGIAVYDKITDNKAPTKKKLSVWARQIKHTSKLSNALIRADMKMLALKMEKRQNI